MNATHTPGPWSVRAQTYRDGFPLVVVAENFYPAAIFGDGDSNRGTAMANARLIAAAPELLDALRRCADRLGEMDCGEELEAARAAIAKATPSATT